MVDVKNLIQAYQQNPELRDVKSLLGFVRLNEGNRDLEDKHWYDTYVNYLTE